MNKELAVQEIFRKYIQFTGLGVEGFAKSYSIEPRAMYNWIQYGKQHRNPSSYIQMSLGRLMEIDYGFKTEYLELDDEEWKELLLSRNIYYLDKRYQKRADREILNNILNNSCQGAQKDPSICETRKKDGLNCSGCVYDESLTIYKNTK